MLDCRIKGNFPLVGPGPVGRIPSMGGLSNSSNRTAQLKIFLILVSFSCKFILFTVTDKIYV